LTPVGSGASVREQREIDKLNAEIKQIRSDTGGSLFWLKMAGTASGTAGQTITAPITAIGVVVLYFEARIRREALDLQVLTEALTPPPAPPAPGLVVAPPAVPN